MDAESMTTLVMYAFFVLIAGLLLWRLSAYFAKSKRRPKGSSYFKSDMRDKWNNR